jgi:hypothetical protein
MLTAAVVNIAVWLAADQPSFAAEKLSATSKPAASSSEVVVPKIWDDQALATWALPVAGLNIPGNHIAEREYYAIPVDNLRTYPVYHPDYEPEGYAEWLKQQPPMPPYAWPTYAPYNNYSRVAYPQAYPYTAWPYIGPFHPYPQVPLGWRKVQLEWDDGYWQLNFRPRTDRWWWFLDYRNW